MKSEKVFNHLYLLYNYLHDIEEENVKCNDAIKNYIAPVIDSKFKDDPFILEQERKNTTAFYEGRLTELRKKEQEIRNIISMFIELILNNEDYY